MKKMFFLFALLCCGFSVLQAFPAGTLPDARTIAANMRRCRNCGRKYDLSSLSYTTKSWKINYCCEHCAREAGAL